MLYSQVTSLYTHSGVIVKINDTPHIYTATDSPNYDFITKTYKTGSMLISIKDYVMTYSGNIIIYKLKEPIDDVDVINNLMNVMINNKNRRFDINVFRQVNTVADLRKNKEYDDRTLCSQTVADALKALNLMSSQINSANMSVGDIEDHIKNSNKYLPPIMLINYYTREKCL